MGFSKTLRASLGGRGFLRHVSIADCGHGDHGPPEAVRNGLEVAVRGASLSEVNGGGEENNTWTVRSMETGRLGGKQRWVR